MARILKQDAYIIAADRLDQLADDKDFDARQERKGDGHGMAKTEDEYAKGYRRSAIALREEAGRL